MSERQAKNDLVGRAREKIAQKLNRASAALTGKEGRHEHKGKAGASNRHLGGKRAR